MLLRCRPVVQAALAEAVSGVYCGWASVGRSTEVYMTAMSIGWCAACQRAYLHLFSPYGQVPTDQIWSLPYRNPYYNNEQRTAEPWLLHDFKEDFYGERV